MGKVGLGVGQGAGAGPGLGWDQVGPDLGWGLTWGWGLDLEVGLGRVGTWMFT